MKQTGKLVEGMAACRRSGVGRELASVRLSPNLPASERTRRSKYALEIGAETGNLINSNSSIATLEQKRCTSIASKSKILVRTLDRQQAKRFAIKWCLTILLVTFAIVNGVRVQAVDDNNVSTIVEQTTTATKTTNGQQIRPRNDLQQPEAALNITKMKINFALNNSATSVPTFKYKHLQREPDTADTTDNVDIVQTQLVPSKMNPHSLMLLGNNQLGQNSIEPLGSDSSTSADPLVVADSKKKKKMMKKKKKEEKKHKEWKKGKKHKKKKYESKKKKGGMEKKKKGKKEKKKWGMEKKGHKKKGNFKKKKWGHKKKMKKGHKKGKKGHKMLKDKGHKKKGFKKVYHKEEWGKKKKWHDIKREKKWNTKQKKWKKKWHQEKGKKYKGKHMKKYHKKNKHGKKYKKEKKSKWKKHKGEKFKKGHKKKKEEYAKKKEGGKKKKMKKMKKEMKKKKG